MDLYEEFFAIVRAFQKSGIRYCVVGGIAMAFHDQPRFTRDIDILVIRDQLDGVRQLLQVIGALDV